MDQRGRRDPAHRGAGDGAVSLLDKSSQNAIGRSTDKSVDAAQRSPVGHTQKQAHAKVAFCLIDGLINACGANNRHQSKGNRKHHGRRSRVGHPGRQEARREHDTEHNLLGLGTHDANRVQSNTTVKTPASDTGSDQEAAQEEIDRIVGVFLERLSRRCNTQEREAHNRQQCSDGNRNSFGKPPDGHPEHHTHASACGVAELSHITFGTDVRFGQDEIKSQGKQGAQDERDDFGLVVQCADLNTGFVHVCLLKEGQLSG